MKVFLQMILSNEWDANNKAFDMEYWTWANNSFYQSFSLRK